MCWTSGQRSAEPLRIRRPPASDHLRGRNAVLLRIRPALEVALRGLERMERNVRRAAGVGVRAARLLVQHVEVRHPPDPVPEQALVQEGVFPKGHLREIDTLRQLRDEHGHYTLRENLDRPVQAVLAIVQVHGLRSPHQHLAHRAAHLEVLPQPVWEEHRVDVKLDCPIVIRIPAHADNPPPHRSQNLSVQRCVPSSAVADSQVDIDNGHPDWQGLLRDQVL
mmetsp:Transcript_29657/g.81623  ORF Transcript_29657/g.81623 Transcript_29657/m.81623 type:complete len:222 (-) Transcript_29657:1071-1736(-)